MSWDFSTDPEFQKKLDWADTFVREHIEHLDLRFPGLHYTPPTPEMAEVITPLKAEVRAQGLWATHLTPDLGGKGYGQVKLALLNEILGRTDWAPTIFGTQAPDTGNAEVLAHYGTPEQKERYLVPLIEGEMFSCYSMTEPQGGSDPGQFRTRAYRDGDDWIIDGWKFFSSNASTASFFVVMTVTDPDLPPQQGMSMFLVPADTPGLTVVRDIGLGGEPLGHGHHGLVHYDKVRLRADALLGEVGQGFAVAQTRLGGGRIHHAMRAVGVSNRVLEMMTERAVSRTTKGSLLGEKGAVEAFIADSYVQIQQFRLLVLHAAWTIDQGGLSAARREIAAVKIAAPQVLHDVVMRGIQLHGALGISNELPLWHFLKQVFVVGFSDGPAEVHRRSLTRSLLKDATPVRTVWPSEHIPTRLGLVPDEVRESLERHVGNL
jgi:acyl-CoA dehydrogenase